MIIGLKLQKKFLMKRYKYNRGEEKVFYLIYMLNKLFDELEKDYKEPKITEAQRKLYEARDMAKWKAWKAKQEQENKKMLTINGKPAFTVGEMQKKAEEELNEFHKLPLEIQEKYTPVYDPRALKYVYIINESINKFTSVNDIINAENIK